MKETLYKISGLALVVTIIISGCKETPPFIDFSEKIIGLKDTTYLASSIPSPVVKAIYIEDLTGVRCNNCPKAASNIHDIIVANPGKVVALGVYASTLTNFMTPWPGFDNLSTTVADDIFKDIYKSPGAIPTGGVNRKEFPGEVITISYNSWSGFADIIKTEESPVVIRDSIITYDSTARKARIMVKVIFTKTYTEELNLSLYLMENKIISKQTMPAPAIVPKDDYEHNHVLRKAITNFSGLPLKKNAATVGNYEAGRVFEKEFEVNIDANWKAKNCAFVILVNRFDDTSKEVLQASELDLQ